MHIVDKPPVFHAFFRRADALALGAITDQPPGAFRRQGHNDQIHGFSGRVIQAASNHAHDLIFVAGLVCCSPLPRGRRSLSRIRIRPQLRQMR